MVDCEGAVGDVVECQIRPELILKIFLMVDKMLENCLNDRLREFWRFG